MVQQYCCLYMQNSRSSCVLHSIIYRLLYTQQYGGVLAVCVVVSNDNDTSSTAAVVVASSKPDRRSMQWATSIVFAFYIFSSSSFSLLLLVAEQQQQQQLNLLPRPPYSWRLPSLLLFVGGGIKRLSCLSCCATRLHTAGKTAENFIITAPHRKVYRS